MKNKLMLMLGILATAILPLMAQPGDPGDPGGGPGGGSPVPLGGIEFLLAAGGLLGIKKVMNQQKSKKVKVSG